ncbi:hypothetical protein ACFQ0B_28420 [Nonomuraea thailandensis]
MVVLGAFFAFFLENMHFPEQHQEYGILSLGAWDNRATYAEPILLEFAADQMGRPIDRTMMAGFTLPVPDYLYPVYAVVGVLSVLVAARLLVGRFGAATLVAGGYVLFRTLIWPLLTFTGFPPSAVPFFMVAAGLLVDLAFLVRMPVVRAVLGAAGVTAVTYGALVAQSAIMGPVYGAIKGQEGLLGAPRRPRRRRCGPGWACSPPGWPSSGSRAGAGPSRRGPRRSRSSRPPRRSEPKGRQPFRHRPSAAFPTAAGRTWGWFRRWRRG